MVLYNISLTTNGYFTVPWKRISIMIWYIVPSDFWIEYPENILQKIMILYPTSFLEIGYISRILYHWIYILNKSEWEIQSFKGCPLFFAKIQKWCLILWLEIFLDGIFLCSATPPRKNFMNPLAEIFLWPPS